MEKEKRTPEIRFAEFASDWQKEKFEKVFKGIANNSLSRDNLNYRSGEVQNVHYGDILVKFGEILDVKKEKLPYVSDEKTAQKLKSSHLINGDIILADAAEDEIVGKCVELYNIEKEVILSGLHTIAVRPTLKFEPKYLGYYMNSKSFHDQLIKLMQGTKVLGISKSAIQVTTVRFPSDLEEQLKISQYITNIAELIIQHQKKHDKLIILKKAMLEKMFPKEGKSVPEIRFNKFSDSWKEKKMEEIGKSTSGTSIESDFLSYGKYKVISIGSYSEQSTYVDQGIRTDLTQKTQKRILNKTDLTMVLNDKTSSGNILGRVLLIEDDKTFVYNQRTQRIEPDQTNYNSQFLYQLFNAPSARKRILNISQGNTQIYVNWSTVKELPYFVPSIEEQRKIGNYFQSLDSLIHFHSEQLTKLSNLKKSCLTKMFV